jgi:Glu-tRNA(Gln) amidotransferase subunit E-like FAD-binding protein
VRVIAGLDQPPILFHSEAWPQEAGEDLARLRSAARCSEQDGLVVVWGPERDARTAADEVRLRYVDATDGIPNETRQPFADGSTDFERILPGPDRMYPDTDSPPTRVTSERVDRLRAALPQRPWERDARYAAAGVPVAVVHYLVRRGGAALVDRVVAEAGADVRAAAFFFGERLKGLRRAGVAVDRIPDDAWVELFHALAARPARREAWATLVRRMASRPGESLATVLAELGLDGEPRGWRALVPGWLEAAERDAYDADAGRMLRHATGRAMGALRGRVPARDVVEAVRAAAEVRR